MRLSSTLFFLSTQILFGQTLPDSILVAKGKAHVIRQYELATEGNHHLYNGAEYITYNPLAEEHPYFLSDEWRIGKLKYDGQWYGLVPLLYDISNQKLVASYYYNGHKMELVKNQVDEFVIEGHWFVHVKAITDSLTMRPGFYEVLHNGPTSVLCRRSKNLKEEFEGTTRTREFAESSQYFMHGANGYKKILFKRDVLNILFDKKPELRQFIRKNKLFMSGNLEYSIIQVSQYYDSLRP